MKNFLRNLFGIRQQRRSLPVTMAPKIGASIVRDGVKIKLAQSCDDEVWEWLVLCGWRVCSVRNDRRHYVQLPLDAITRLKAASVSERDSVMEELLHSARTRHRERQTRSEGFVSPGLLFWLAPAGAWFAFEGLLPVKLVLRIMFIM